MLDFFKPSFWFQKRTSAIDDARVRLEQMSQYNALFHLDPDKIVGAITAYNSGDLAQLAHIIRDLEQHDDKMATCSMKMRASVGRCDYSVLVKEGFENDERAKLHAEILKRFWSTVTVTSRFNQNERGGLRLLKKQMMEAQSFGYAVHEIVWHPLPNGEIAATFIKLPLWHFENKTGALRFLPTTTSSYGVPMAEGEWLVTTGDGVGIPASICAMAKRMSFQDWLLFSERSGMPIIVGKTGAAFKSDQWNNIKSAIRSIYRDTRVLLDSASSIEAIDTGHAANIPFPPLVEWADRAIAALYRGADLSTISKGDGTGASLQGDESGMIEQDAAANLGETLHEQVDRFVIRYVTGDDEPLAQIVIEPVSKPDVDTDIKIDRHLAELGVKLSKADALSRYGRTEAQGDDDALELVQDAPQNGFQTGLNGLPNEIQGKTPFKNPNSPFKNSPGNPDGQGDGSGSRELLEAFSRDLGPAAEEVKSLLADLDAGKDVTEAAKSLVEKLSTLMPDDPAMAAVIAEAMAKEFGTTLANETDAQGNKHDDLGRFTEKGTGSAGSNKKDEKSYGQNLKAKLNHKWLKQWDEVDELNDLFDKYANADGEERERAGDVMRKKFAELNAKGIVERNPKDGRAFRVKDAPSREFIMKDDEWERTGRQKYNDPTQRLSFVDLPNEITNPCPKCHRNIPKGGTCSFCAKRAANHSAGKTAFDEVAKTHKDKVGAMERDSIGKIDFIWGDDTEGICHILGKHKTTAQQIPGVLAYGDVYEDKEQGKFYVIKKRYVAVLRKRTGSNHYLITGFKAESPDYAAKIRKECSLVESGE